ncbi:response regulator [Paenibacillus sp. FSL L8-0470]|uniref:response regulator n=1 Tax=unclassified Paenibacillus TaxID=185978 RepID=UPI0030F98B4C
MIRAVLVDDERLALMNLKMMLEALGNVAIVATFTDSRKAVSEAAYLNPDVIFLDIDMPELNGLQAAEIIQIHCPRTSIVFVTAYNSYAVDAFELHALDYVLKPVRKERLIKTLARVEKKMHHAPQVNNGSEMMIRCFQCLRFERNGLQLHDIRWRTAKGQELFAFLFHHRNRFISKDTLIDLLWPDFNLKKASNHLYTTIYQVRQCLKQGKTDLQIRNLSGGEGYKLETGSMLVDSTEWEKGILSLEPINAGNYGQYQYWFGFYSGDYLADYDYLWAESERQRLRSIWLHHAMEMAEFYIGCGKIPEAVTVYQRIVQLQPYFEQGHLGLMKVYDRIGERSAVEEQYNILTDLLNRELSIELPVNIERWYHNWKHHLL